MSRTQRQEIINGWDQERLRDCTVALVGSTPSANYILAQLIGLSVGKVYIIDDKRAFDSNPSDDGFLLKLEKSRLPSNAMTLEKIARKMNSEIEIHGRETYFYSFLASDIDIIMDTTNDPYSKSACKNYAIKKDIPFISCSASENKSVVSFSKKNKLESIISNSKHRNFSNDYFKNEKQGHICTIPTSAIAVEELRKSCFSLAENDKNLENEVVYNLESKDRLSHKNDFGINVYDLFRDETVAVVGGGALGNALIIGLSQMNVGHIDIIDFDVVEVHNQNRQILFYEAINCNKAEVLARRAKEINPKLNDVNSIVSKFDESFESYIKERRPKIIYACVDNYRARSLINKLAAKYHITYINGGTSAFSGNSSVYMKGYTPCLDCQIGVDSKIEAEEKRRAELAQRGCLFAEPSVVMSNFATAGSMLAETRPVFNHLIYGSPLNKIFKYNMKNGSRIFYTPMPSPKSNCEYGCGDSK